MQTDDGFVLIFSFACRVGSVHLFRKNHYFGTNEGFSYSSKSENELLQAVSAAKCSIWLCSLFCQLASLEGSAVFNNICIY